MPASRHNRTTMQNCSHFAVGEGLAPPGNIRYQFKTMYGEIVSIHEIAVLFCNLDISTRGRGKPLPYAFKFKLCAFFILQRALYRKTFSNQ